MGAVGASAHGKTTSMGKITTAEAATARMTVGAGSVSVSQRRGRGHIKRRLA